MSNKGNNKYSNDEDLQDWVDALENLVLFNGKEHASNILKSFLEHANNKGITSIISSRQPFENSISQYEETEYPGDWEVEEKIRHFIRWNALVTVLKANKELDLGGHISTYSSAATLYEVGFNHFFRGGTLSDMVYFQGHSSPGIYARSFLEGSLTEQHLNNFRQADT